jgi:putative hydrolase of the HAD superfamily
VTFSQRLDRLIIFDLDNTLVERDRFFAEWVEAFVRKRHLDLAPTLAILSEADEDGSAPRTLFFERVRAPLMLEEPTNRLVDDYWRDQIARYRCDEETIAGLRRLRQAGYKLGIANRERRHLHGNIPVVATYHPSPLSLHRQPARRAMVLKDLSRTKDLLDGQEDPLLWVFSGI